MMTLQEAPPTSGLWRLAGRSLSMDRGRDPHERNHELLRLPGKARTERKGTLDKGDRVTQNCNESKEKNTVNAGKERGHGRHQLGAKGLHCCCGAFCKNWARTALYGTRSNARVA